MNSRRQLFALVISSLLVACGGRNESAPADTGVEVPTDAVPTDAVPADTATDPASMATAFAEALCDGYAGCCTQAGMTEDRERCVSGVRDNYKEAITYGLGVGMKFDASALPACTAALREAKTACDGDSLAFQQILERVCRRAFLGATPAGDECGWHLECELPAGGYSHCKSSMFGGVLCQSIVIVDLGEPCEPFSSDPVWRECDEAKGLACDENKRCVKKLEAGVPCPSVSTCLGLCNSQRICEALRKLGETCLGNDCEAGSQCDPRTKICTQTKPLGGTCEVNVDCASRTCRDKRCVPAPVFGVVGICR